MNTKNWLLIAFTTAAAASVGTVASVSLANCDGNVVSNFFGSSSCVAPSGASGTGTGTANNPFPRTLRAFYNSTGAGDTKAQAIGFKSTGVSGCSVTDSTVDGTGNVTGCAAINSVSMAVRVF
jgi:hypothetical protein